MHAAGVGRQKLRRSKSERVGSSRFHYRVGR
jgi:hypothetical protein